MHIISTLEQVQGRLQHAYVRLGKFSAPRRETLAGRELVWRETNLDAHENEGLEVTAANQREEFGRDHREERLFDGGEAQCAERRKVDAVIGLTEGYGRVHNGRERLSNRELN